MDHLMKLTSRNLLFLAVLAGSLTLGACDEKEAEVTRKAKSEEAKDQKAKILPPGVREAWFAAIDQAMAQKVQIHQGQVTHKIGKFEHMLYGVSYIPRSQVGVECGGFMEGVRLLVPPRDEDTDGRLTLIGSVVESEIYDSLLSPGFGKNPSGKRISHNSPAALNLMKEVCRRAIDLLAKMENQSPGQLGRQ